MKLNDDEKSNDHFVLSTGKTIYANRAILGLSAYTQEAHILFEGYDGHHRPEEFTPEERKEIAEYMTQLWNEWAKGT